MLDRHEDTLVILAKNIEVEMHHHHAVQLVVSLDNPYNAVLDCQDIESVRGFLIDSNIPHACQSADSTVLVISVDATSAKGRMLKQQLSKRTFALIDEIFSIEAINLFLADYWRYCGNAENKFDSLYLVHQLSHGQNDVTASVAVWAGTAITQWFLLRQFSSRSIVWLIVGVAQIPIAWNQPNSMIFKPLSNSD